MAAKQDQKAATPAPRHLLTLLELGTFNPKMGAFECCEKLGEAGAAYRMLYPGSEKPGRRYSQRMMGFASSVASRVGLSKQQINSYITIYAKLTPASRASLRQNDHGARLIDLRALSALSPKAQARALDLIDKGQSATLAEAIERAGKRPGIAPRLRPSEKRFLANLPSALLASELRLRGWHVTEGGEDG